MDILNQKLNAAFFILYLLSRVTAIAQSDNTQNKSFISGNKNFSDYSVLLDSVVRYKYNSVIDSTPLTKTIYIYNGRGLKIKQFEFKRSTEDLWEDSVKFDWTYDVSGNMTSEIKSTWYPYDPSCYPDEYNNCDRSIPTWVFDYKNIWNYNSRNKLTLKEKYFWSLDQNKWIGDVNTARLEYLYNEKDSLISSKWSNWNSELNKWIYTRILKDSYDNEGNKIFHSESFYSKASGWYTSEEIFSTFDTANHKTIEEVHEWDFGCDCLRNHSKSYYTYNDIGDEILMTAYVWNDLTNQWVESSGYKKEYIYDDNLNVLSCIRFYRPTGSTSFTKEYKWEYMYDSNEHLILSARYNWQSELSIWTGIEKTEWRYDEKNRLIRWDNFDWDYSKNGWINGDFLHRYFYDESGNLLTHLEYNPFYELVWVMGHEYKYVKYDLYYRLEFYYNENGQDTLCKSVCRTDSINWYNWECEPKIHKAYDVNGNLVMITEDKSSKKEYRYDNSGVLLMSAEYLWSWSANDWQGTKKWEEAFDNENFILYHTDYKWDQNSKSWLVSEKEFYYRSNHIMTAPTVSENKFCIISPNPSDGLFKIELNDPVDCLLEVYTTDGRKVYSTRTSGIEMSINLTELNPGLYFVVLTSEKIRSTNKIIIE